VKRCVQCQNELPDTAVHCVYCGGRQVAVPAPVAGPGARTVMGYPGMAGDLARQAGMPPPAVGRGGRAGSPQPVNAFDATHLGEDRDEGFGAHDAMRDGRDGRDGMNGGMRDGRDARGRDPMGGGMAPDGFGPPPGRAPSPGPRSASPSPHAPPHAHGRGASPAMGAPEAPRFLPPEAFDPLPQQQGFAPPAHQPYGPGGPHGQAPHAPAPGAPQPYGPPPDAFGRVPQGYGPPDAGYGYQQQGARPGSQPQPPPGYPPPHQGYGPPPGDPGYPPPHQGYGPPHGQGYAPAPGGHLYGPPPDGSGFNPVNGPGGYPHQPGYGPPPLGGYHHRPETELVAPLRAPFPGPAPRAPVAHGEPWGESLKTLMLVFGVLLIACFVAPWAVQPGETIFSWSLFAAEVPVSYKMVPILFLATGILSVLLGALPLSMMTRGFAAAGIGLAPIVFQSVAPSFQWRELLGLVGAATLVAGLLVRSHYTGELIGRLLATVGAVCVFLQVLIPVGGQVPLVALFQGIGQGQVAAMLPLVPVIVAILALLVWLPPPSHAGAHILAWILIVWPLVNALIVWLTGDNPGEALKAQLAEILYTPMAQVAWTALTGFGVATVIGRQLEHG
jgi:hypothetical protein